MSHALGVVVGQHAQQFAEIPNLLKGRIAYAF